jgi:sugar phosphate isomerase/epimerase
MVKGNPNPSEEWMKYFKDLCQKYELDPVCYSIYVENGKNHGRFLNEAERMAATINDMEYAKRMGFKYVRSQDALTPKTMEKLLPYVEELDLHLAIELHGPYSPSTPIFMEYEELFDKKNTDHLGIVMDMSSFTSGAPETVLSAFPDDVCHKDILKKIRTLFETTEISEEKLIEMIYEEGGDDADVIIAKNKLFTGLEPGGKMGTIYYRTKPDYAGFRRLLKHSKYIHGKYWYVDENLNCSGINMPEFVKIMKEEGYKGYVCTEYEGHRFDHTLDNEEQIARHIKMMKKLWNEV